MTSDPDDITRGSSRVSSPGVDGMLGEVYEELRGLARHYLRGERRDHTLQPTALVHEAYLRLSKSDQFENRAHFYQAAALAMRRILVNHARDRGRLKRAASHQRVPLVEGLAVSENATIELQDLDEALYRLADAEPRGAQVVELRFFAGLSIDEVAEILQLSPATVKREWSFAKAWLLAEIADAGAGGDRS